MPTPEEATYWLSEKNKFIMPYKLAEAGEDVYIAPTVIIKRPGMMHVGSHIAIDDFSYITTEVHLGDYIHIAPYTSIIGGAKALFRAGHFASMAAGCRVVCASDELLGAGLVGPVMPPEFRDNVIVAPVVMEPFATLGTNVVVLPGVTLGEGSIVGACSLVTKSTEPWTIYTGTPARPVKKRASQMMKEYAKRLGYDM